MERNKHRGPGGASCFIWQIEAPYPHGPVITQESRVNKEKSRPLLPLFLLSITFSHSPSIRYNPLLFSLCGPHCLLPFLPPSPLPSLRFVPSTVCSPEGIFQGSSNSLAGSKKTLSVLHCGALAACLGRGYSFTAGVSLDCGRF